MMTDYVGGPEDNVFNITHKDGASNIDGGAGFDILNVDYSAYPALYPIGVALKPDQITFNTKYNVFTSYFSNIEHINIKQHHWGGKCQFDPYQRHGRW